MQLIEDEEAIQTRQGREIVETRRRGQVWVWGGFAAILLVALGLHLWRLGTPPQMYFDEIQHAGGAESLLWWHGKFDDWTHPPLSHTIMAQSLKVFTTFIPSHEATLPFAATHALYGESTDTLFVFSSTGQQVAAFSPTRSDTDVVVHDLPSGITRFYPGDSLAPLYGYSPKEGTLLRLTPEGKRLSRFALPSAPDYIFTRLRYDSHAVLVWLQTGQVQGVDFANATRLWERRFPSLLNAAADVRRGVVFLGIERSHSVVALDYQGKTRWQGSVPVAPAQLIPLWAPPLIRRPRANPEPILYIVYVLSPDRTQTVSLRTGQSPRLRRLRLPRSVHAVTWHPDSQYFFLQGPTSIYQVNGYTGEVINGFWATDGMKTLFLNRHGDRLMELTSAGRTVRTWHLLSRSWSARLPAALIGGLLLPCLGFLIIRRWYPSSLSVLLVPLLLVCDPLLFLLGRMAMIDIYVTVFLVAAYGAALVSLRIPIGWKRTIALAMTGILLRLALACKWSAASALVGIGLLLWLAHHGWGTEAASSSLQLSRRSIFVQYVAALMLLPLVVYFLCYMMVVKAGTSWGEVLRLQAKMLRFHVTFPHSHDLASSWWQWLLGMKVGSLFHDDEGVSGRWIYLCGAPWLWLPGLICVAIAAVRAWRMRELFPAFIVIAFACAWLPWMFSPRSVFLYYFSPALPFLYMAVAYVIGNVHSGAWQVSPRWRERILLLCDGYLLLAVFTLVWLYPTLTGYPLPYHAGHRYNAWWMGWLPAIAPR